MSETVLHAYVSTACLHGQCDYCAASARPDGVPKEPARCKFCEAPCLCPCHWTVTTRGEPE